jgi:hypothetical protein
MTVKEDHAERSGPFSAERLARLATIYDRIFQLTDPVLNPVRLAEAWGRAADALEDEALMSGAMRGEVAVMLMYRRTGSGSVMTPFLK